LPFGHRLHLVGDVLPLAPATSAEVATPRFNARRTGFEQFEYLGVRELSLLADDPCAHPVAGYAALDEHDKAVGAGDRFSPIAEPFNHQLEF